MTIATAPNIDTQPLLLDVSNTTLTVTPEQFDKLCVDNPDLPTPRINPKSRINGYGSSRWRN
jgi:hypothetical protein